MPPLRGLDPFLFRSQGLRRWAALLSAFQALENVLK